MTPKDIQNALVDQTRTLITETASRLTLDNLKACRREIGDAFDFLEFSMKQPLFQTPSNKSVQTETPPPPEATPPSSEPAEAENSGLFRRRLRGGNLIRKNEILCPVPERVVRQMRLKSGDAVHAEPRPNEPERFVYRLVSRTKAFDPDAWRRSYAFCPVESVDGQLIITRSLQTGKTLSIGGRHQPFMPTPEDEKRFRLTPGAVVDLAYNADKPEEKPAISWRYALQDVTRDLTLSSLEPNYPQTLAGETVSTVGGGDLTALLEAAILRRGGRFVDSGSSPVDLDHLKTKNGVTRLFIFIGKVPNLPATALSEQARKIDLPSSIIWAKPDHTFMRLMDE